MAKPWLIYARVSTDDQAREGTSLDAQTASCEAMAKALGLEVAAVIRDEGESAKDLKRPGVQRVLDQVDKQLVAGVIIYKLDRLTRSRRDLDDLLPMFDRKGAALISVSEKLDTSSAMGRFFIAMLGAIAQWERETIAERVTMGMRHRKGQGGFVGGHAPAGLVAIGQPGKRTLQIDERWGPVVANVWPQLLQGRSLREVAAYLSREGLPSSRASTAWTPTGVRSIALSPRYLGLLCSKDQQERTRAVLSSRFSPTRPDGTPLKTTSHSTRIYLLSGIARCGECGSALVGANATNARGVVYPYYRCTGRQRQGPKKCRASDLRAEPWEAAVVDMLVRAVNEHGKLQPALAELAATKRAVAVPLAAEHEQLVKQRDKLDGELQNLTELAAQGGDVAKGLGQGIASRQAKWNELERRIGRLEGELAAARMTAEQAEALAMLLRDRIDVLAEAAPEDQARDLRQLVASATLRRDPSDKKKGEVDLAINLPRTGDPLFVSAWPIVVRCSPDPNTVGWTDAVVLAFPTPRSPALAPSRLA